MKQMNCSMGFVMNLEEIMNYLSKDNSYMAQIGKVTIRYEGEIEDTANGKRQLFSIVRKVD